MTRRTAEPFWMVYGVGQGAPTIRHKGRATAEQEAKRLARLNPEIEFFVLETVSRAVKIDVDLQRLDGDRDGDGIPF